MKLFVFGGLAMDELSTFPGQFQNAFHSENLKNLSVSFVVEDRQVHFGGCAGNIAYSLGLMKIEAHLIGLLGEDSEAKEYVTRLNGLGMKLENLDTKEGHTAHASLYADQEGNQIAFFAPGVIGPQAEDFSLPTLASAGDILFVAPENPRRMLQAVHAGAEKGLRVFFDPGQLMHVFTSSELLIALKKADTCFVNSYEWSLLQEKTGLNAEALFELCPNWFITRGADGVQWTESKMLHDSPAYPVPGAIHPTGAGDAFRAGILAGIRKGWTTQDSVDLGQGLGAIAIKNPSAQSHLLKDLPAFLSEKLSSNS